MTKVPSGANGGVPNIGAVRAGARRDGLVRSLRLLNEFRVEQTDPDRFYGVLATDAVRLIEEYARLSGRTILDAGAGPPQFCQSFREAGARYVALDLDARVLPAVRAAGGQVVGGRAERLPFRSELFDVTFSSNVLEHVASPFRMADELVRVTRQGGLVFLSYTNWLSPWGGHETSPFHYLGGTRAIRYYTRRYGHPPKNRVGENVFKVSVAAGLDWAASHPEAALVDARPRYLPTWSRPILRAPGLREVLTWNVLLVLRRR